MVNYKKGKVYRKSVLGDRLLKTAHCLAEMLEDVRR